MRHSSASASYGNQLLSARIVLDTDRLRVRTSFADLGDEAPAFGKLTVAANDALQAVVPPDASNGTATEFERMTGHAGAARVIGDPEDAEAWIDALARAQASEGDFLLAIGASYLPANLARLVDAVARLERADTPLELIWLRPGGSSWGRTLRVPEALQQLRATARNAGRQDVRTALLMPRSTPKTVRSAHKRLFDRGQLLPQGHLPANLEVLLVPGIAALVSVHLAVGGHAVPLGGVVTDARRLARIADRLAPGQVAGWEDLWRRQEARPGAPAVDRPDQARR